MAVEDEESLVGQRLAVRDALPLRPDVFHGEEIGPDGSLRGAAEAEEPQLRPEGPDASGQAQGDPVPAEQCAAQGRQGSGMMLQMGGKDLEERGDAVPDAHLMPVHQLQPVGRLQTSGGIRQDQGPARAEQAEHVPDGQVEGEARKGQDPVRRPQPGQFVDSPDGVDGTLVADHDPLGRARGTRSVDDIGQRFRVAELSFEIKFGIQFQ